MTEDDLHEESERLIEEARLEIEAIKVALEAARDRSDADRGPKKVAARTN